MDFNKTLLIYKTNLIDRIVQPAPPPPPPPPQPVLWGGGGKWFWNIAKQRVLTYETKEYKIKIVEVYKNYLLFRANNYYNGFPPSFLSK